MLLVDFVLLVMIAQVKNPQLKKDYSKNQKPLK